MVKIVNAGMSTRLPVHENYHQRSTGNASVPNRRGYRNLTHLHQESVGTSQRTVLASPPGWTPRHPSRTGERTRGFFDCPSPRHASRCSVENYDETQGFNTRPRSPSSAAKLSQAQARASYFQDGPRLLASRGADREVCMKTYLTKDIRNVGIVGHGGTGKTQLVSSLLFTEIGRASCRERV